jgi:hypothetical protein
MPSIRLEIKYSTNEIPGKCVQCLAEDELHTCLRSLLRGDDDDKNLKEKYEMLVAFLHSPELVDLRVRSEKYLSDGKKVALKIHDTDGKPRYELEVS